MIFDKLFKKKEEIKWNNNNVLPKENSRIVVINIYGDVFTGYYIIEKGKHIFSMYEFMGLPFFNWNEIKFWAYAEEFKKVNEIMK